MESSENSKHSNSSDKAMEKPPEKKALGRGLAALFNETQASSNPYPGKSEANTSNVSNSRLKQEKDAELLLEHIQPNPDQPRKHFEESKLHELADSIHEQGLIQPIVVKKRGENDYVIIAGERRWRASKLAGLKKVPVYVRDASLSETENDLASLVENIQREELNAIELAEAYERLLEKKTLTQDSLAKKLGVSRVSITNSLRLLKLPVWARELIVLGKLKEGHARVLLSLPNEELMKKLSDEIQSEALSVRAVEARARELMNPPTQTVKLQGQDLSEEQRLMAATEKEANSQTRDPEIISLEAELRKLFGTRVRVKGGSTKGSIEISYFSEDSLERVLHMIRKAHI